MMTAKPGPMLTLLQYLVPGAGLTILGLIVSLFQTGARAEFMRIASLGPILALGIVGLARALWVLATSQRSN